MDPESEAAAILAAKADPQRFTPLYERYFADIYRFVERRIRDRQRSADITQDTFLRAMLALPRYTDRGLPFRAWLYRIALNEVRMYWRKKKEILVEMSFAEVLGLTEEIGLPPVEEEMARLAQAMGRLDEAKAHLIELRFMDGLSFQEIGQILGIAEDAAKMRTHRVLATLRTYLSPRA